MQDAFLLPLCDKCKAWNPPGLSPVLLEFIPEDEPAQHIWFLQNQVQSRERERTREPFSNQVAHQGSFCPAILFSFPECNQEDLGTPMSTHNLLRGSSGDRQGAPVTSPMQINIPVTPTREVSSEQPGFSLVDPGYGRKPEKEERTHRESASTTHHFFPPFPSC